MSGWHGKSEALRRRKWTTSSSSDGKKWKPGGSRLELEAPPMARWGAAGCWNNRRRVLCLVWWLSTTYIGAVCVWEIAREGETCISRSVERFLRRLRQKPGNSSDVQLSFLSLSIFLIMPCKDCCCWIKREECVYLALMFSSIEKDPSGAIWKAINELMNVCMHGASSLFYW